jgi:hypothetical protein
VLIVKNEDEVIFSRTINSESHPLATVIVYQQAYGEPEKIIKGSKVYGAQAATYVYASIGLAFIANQQTGTTYEEQTFSFMSADEYLKLYGNQN